VVNFSSLKFLSRKGISQVGKVGSPPLFSRTISFSFGKKIDAMVNFNKSSGGKPTFPT
jgi:hypothetical protein